MNGAVNGFSINGTVLPSWVVRAVVVATAAATVASSEPTRTTYATAHGDAAVAVSLTQTHTIQARATGTASVSSSIEPTLRFAGASVATATATGNGAVRRDVWATAGGDATCTADVLTAHAIGEAQATAVSTVDLALAHIIHPGRSVTLCEASSSASGDVTRYAVAFLTYGYAGPSWGEASVKRNGNSYFEHDSYSLATSTASFGIANALTSTIVTQPIYASMQCIGQSKAFVIQPAQCLGLGSSLDQPSLAQSVQSKYGALQTTAESNASADAVRIKMASAESESVGIQYILKPAIKQAASSFGSIASSYSEVGDSLRTAFAGASGFFGNADLIETSYGVQHFADAESVASNTGTTSALQHFMAHASSIASCVAAKPIHGTQHRATVSDSGQATADRVPLSVLRQGGIDTTMATALVGRAYAIANSEIRAPDDRYMIVGQEVRAMIVSAEERMMMVTA